MKSPAKSKPVPSRSIASKSIVSRSATKVEDAQIAYYSTPSYNHFLGNPLSVSELIEKGMSYSFFNKLAKTIPLSEEEWADMLQLSTKSLQRYKLDNSFVFKPIHAEKIMEITEVTYLGLEVFLSIHKFKNWLKIENFALGNHTPQDLLRNSYGKDLVINELQRIQHGIFS